jgi:hypothetical protein
MIYLDRMAIKFPDQDTIIYASQPIGIQQAFLEPYFYKHPQKRPGGSGTRNYWATYGFTDELLFVKDIEVPDARNLKTGLRSVLQEVFPEAEDREIRTYSGLLVLTLSKHHFAVVELRRGRLTATRRYDATQLEQFKSDQFEYFQLTDDYEALKAGARKEFELKEQDARRKDAGRGYKLFDDAGFDAGIARDILVHARQIFAD